MDPDDGALRISPSVAIPLAEIELRFTPSGGPGGQHANRSNTRVEVRFDIASSPSLSAHHRDRLVERLGPTVRVVADDERSQLRNRELALERLRGRLAAPLHRPVTRRATRPTKGATERRLQAKRQRSERKSQRRPPTSDGD